MTPSLRRTLRTWMLPVVLVGAAVGLHFAIHVPRGEYEPRAPKDAPHAKAVEAAQKKVNPKGFRPRRPVLLEELRRTYRAVPFDDEPVDDAFARAHERALTRAVSVARTSAFVGAPEVPQLDTEVGCRTIRCRVDVCSTFPPELDLFTAALQSLRIGKHSLFDRVDVEPTTRGGLGKEPEGEPCYRLLVSFARDLPEADEIEAPGPDAGPPEPRP